MNDYKAGTPELEPHHWSYLGQPVWIWGFYPFAEDAIMIFCWWYLLVVELFTSVIFDNDQTLLNLLVILQNVPIIYSQLIGVFWWCIDSHIMCLVLLLASELCLFLVGFSNSSMFWHNANIARQVILAEKFGWRVSPKVVGCQSKFERPKRYSRYWRSEYQRYQIDCRNLHWPHHLFWLLGHYACSVSWQE